MEVGGMRWGWGWDDGQEQPLYSFMHLFPFAALAGELYAGLVVAVSFEYLKTETESECF